MPPVQVIIQIQITLSSVLEEVGRITNYAGRRKDTEGSEYERISTNDSDNSMLTQFWNASCDIVTDKIKPFISTVNSTNTTYDVSIVPSKSFDILLEDSFINNVQQFIILYIVSKWYQLLSNKGDSETYEIEAMAQMNEAMKKLYFKKKPTRINPTQTTQTQEQTDNEENS